MRDILVAAIIFGAIPFILRRPWLGILFFSWLSYMNPHRLGWGFAYDFPFAMIVAITTITAFFLSREKKAVPWSPEIVLLLLFVGWMLFTTVFAFFPDLAWTEWNRVWKIQLMVLLTAMLINDRQKLNWLIWVIVLSLGFFGIKGGIFTIASGGSYHVYGPEQSFIAENNALALALIMTIPLIRYLQINTENKWIRLCLLMAMLLTAVAAIGSQSRGGLLAILAMGLFLGLKSRNKLAIGFLMLLVAGGLTAILPQSWYQRMDTIKDYQEDASAMGRINAWHTAFNLASDRITGGGFNTFQPQIFQRYAPHPLDVHDSHSIYFEVLGEHGFIGLGLFVSFWLFAWFRASRVIHACRNDPEKKWAVDLAAMAQVSVVGYAVGGAFLGLAYFDLPYHILIIIILTAKFTGLLGSSQKAEVQRTDDPAYPSSAQWKRKPGYQRK